MFDFKSTMTSLKDKEAVKETAKEMTNKVNDFVNNVPEGKENLFGMGGGILSILNTLFLGVITIKVPFFGNYSIGFFKGISELADFSKEAKNARFILMFSVTSRHRWCSHTREVQRLRGWLSARQPVVTESPRKTAVGKSTKTKANGYFSRYGNREDTPYEKSKSYFNQDV